MCKDTIERKLGPESVDDDDARGEAELRVRCTSRKGMIQAVQTVFSSILRISAMNIQSVLFIKELKKVVRHKIKINT